MKTKGEQKATCKKTNVIKSSLRVAPILISTGTRVGKGAARRRRRTKRTRLTRHAAIFSSTYPPAQDMLRRIRMKVAAKDLERTRGDNPLMEEDMTPTTILTQESRSKMQRTSLTASSSGASYSSHAPGGLTRDGLKQALLAKAASDKSKTHGVEVSKKPNSAKITNATDLGLERLPDTRPTENNAIMRLLGR